MRDVREVSETIEIVDRASGSSAVVGTLIVPRGSRDGPLDFPGTFTRVVGDAAGVVATSDPGMDSLRFLLRVDRRRYNPSV